MDETYSKVTRLAAVVAPSASTSTGQAKCRAVGLDVTQSLTVVALLGLRSPRKGAAVRLVTGLLA